MPISRAEAYAPATVANLGVGFDVLGLALDRPGDIIIAEWGEASGVTIGAIEGDDGRLPRDPAKNTAGAAAASVLRLAGETRGVKLSIIKGLPSASGLGSSAASAVGAALAVNALIGEPFTRSELLPACLDGEAIASGYHADNIAPCLFGGITLAYGLTSDQIISLPVPSGLWLALVTPAIEVPTMAARAALPASVPLRMLVAQTAGIARLVSAIYTNDIASIAAAMEMDQVIEPARAHLMPLLSEARATAKRAGALGLAISGAGPTLIAVCDLEPVAFAAASAMSLLYTEAGLDNQTRVTTISTAGAEVRGVTEAAGL